MNECLFCKMVSGDIPCEKVYENELILSFRDIDPKAPTHILIIPKKHIETLNEIDENDQNLLGELLLTAKKLLKMKELMHQATERFLIVMLMVARPFFIFTCIYLVDA